MSDESLNTSSSLTSGGAPFFPVGSVSKISTLDTVVETGLVTKTSLMDDHVLVCDPVCVYMYWYVSVCGCMGMCMCTCIGMCLCGCMGMWLCMCTCIGMCLCVYVWVRDCVFVNVLECDCLCVYIDCAWMNWQVAVCATVYVWICYMCACMNGWAYYMYISRMTMWDMTCGSVCETTCIYVWVCDFVCMCMCLCLCGCIYVDTKYSCACVVPVCTYTL